MIRATFHLRHLAPMPRCCGGTRIPAPFNHISRRVLAGGSDREEGAALVEFAIASVILFAILLGIFEFSLAFYSYHYVSSAARLGSRYAIVRGFDCQVNLPLATSDFHCGATESDIARYVKTLGYPGIDPGRMTVTVSTCPARAVTDANGNSTTTWGTCVNGTAYNKPGDQVQVTVRYDFPLSIPFWKQETVPVRSTSNMVYSQ